MSVKGSLLFAKYGFSPNKFGYCGPKNSRAIFDYCVADQSDRYLIEILKKFEGAVPYLELIAFTNKIDDIFHERIAEAYWIGNELLFNVSNKIFYESLNSRFRKKIGKKPMKWILTKPVIGAKPHHSFHVLDIYTKTGLARSGLNLNVINTINNCLILWGKVVKVNNEKLKDKSVIIEYRPIILHNNNLKFDSLKKKELISSFISPRVGNWVSFHWGNLCEILSHRKLYNLKYWTNYHLDIANKTI